MPSKWLPTSWIIVTIATGCVNVTCADEPLVPLVGTVVDDADSSPLAARIYIESEQGTSFFVESADPQGTAVPYQEQWVPMEGSFDRHTTVSAHAFRAMLPAGRYAVTIERGKEYFPLQKRLEVTQTPLREEFRLRRWINMAERGWYSGETHVHRRLTELPNVQLAEDVNVTFPVTYWTTKAFETPGLEPSPLRRQGPSPFGPREDRGAAVISVDTTHVMFPRNTEYEIFTVGSRRHVLGAVFVLNHRSIFSSGMPPVASIAEQAHAEGALLDLDKHNWPWSMMLVPVAKIDLYELANNSVWRTQFGFRQSEIRPADYMRIESDLGGMTEWGWLNFGFENYYALLNCSFRLQPTAGTASGVHPVPLGFGRVYVHTGGSFSGDAWLDGLRKGRSFVTTGPMLLATMNDSLPGHEFAESRSGDFGYRIRGEALSDMPLTDLEIVVDGIVRDRIAPTNNRTAAGGYKTEFEREVRFRESGWVALRCFAKANNRVRFAHTAPWHVSIAGQSVRPRQEEIQYLIDRMQQEIVRNGQILPEAALAEFRQALAVYESIAQRARP